jgi:integrase
MKFLTPSTRRDKVFVIPEEVMAEMRGGVYRHRDGFRVYFRGQWFNHDEHGRPFKAEFYAYSFLEHLNSLYDPDPAKNRYDPSRFKSKTPYRFDEAFELYLSAKMNDSGWHQSKRWIWKKYFIPYFANQDFRTIDTVQLSAFLHWLEAKNLKGKTMRNIIMVLHGFLNHFRQAINLFPEFPKIQYQQPRIRWFTDKEINQVFEFIHQEDRGYFLFIRFYGVRPEEASGLLRKNVNWETGEILISTVYVDGKLKQRTKTMRERALPIIPEMEEYLRMNLAGKFRNLTGPESGASLGQPDSLFVFHVNGRPYSTHIRENRWNEARHQAMEKYGTRSMTLRDLRHSAATHWRRSGISLDLIAKILGHSDSRVTDRFYADVSTHELIPIVRGKS